MVQPKLGSEKVVVSAPMSLTGSAQRIWKMTAVNSSLAKVFLIPLALLIILFVWMIVVCWYIIFGIFLVPYRILRRGSRKRKAQALRHREQLDAMADMQQQQMTQTQMLMQQQTQQQAQTIRDQR